MIVCQKTGEERRIEMIRIFKTEEGTIHQKDEAESGCWIALTDPTATEILEIANRYDIDPDHVKAPVDE